MSAAVVRGVTFTCLSLYLQELKTKQLMPLRKVLLQKMNVQSLSLPLIQKEECTHKLKICVSLILPKKVNRYVNVTSQSCGRVKSRPIFHHRQPPQISALCLILNQAHAFISYRNFAIYLYHCLVVFNCGILWRFKMAD